MCIRDSKKTTLTYKRGLFKSGTLKVEPLPELKEGEIYVLYTKAARVQENLMLEVEKAEEEKGMLLKY